MHICFKCVPHARGDEPEGVVKPGLANEVFPTHVGMNRRDTIAMMGIAHVFPTHVGMNRRLSSQRSISASVPHARGDEPQVCNFLDPQGPVFPTHVGMNRRS